jgi:hypothetical protein
MRAKTEKNFGMTSLVRAALNWALVGAIAGLAGGIAAVKIWADPADARLFILVGTICGPLLFCRHPIRYNP